MYPLYIAAFALFIFASGLFVTKWNSPLAPGVMQINVAKEIAENILNNSVIVKQWAENQSITNQIVTAATLSAYKTYSLVNKGDYQAVIVTDSLDNTYEIYSWNNIYDKKTTADDVIGQLVNISSQSRGAYGTTWSIPLIIQNTNCTANIMNGFLAPIKQNLSGYNTLFTTLCNQASAIGAPVAKYAIMIQVN